MKTIKIIENKDCEVHIDLEGHYYDKRKSIYRSTAGYVYPRIYHRKTSSRAYVNMLNQLINQLNGKSMKRKLLRIIPVWVIACGSWMKFLKLFWLVNHY